MSKQSKRERQRLNREARREYEEQLARRRRMFRVGRWLAIILVPALAVGIYLVATKEEKKNPAVAVGCRAVKQPRPKDVQFAAPEQTITDTTKTYVAEVQTSCGSFTVQLAAAEAPQTVNSFVFLANSGFYDGLTFHRLVKDFVIQGGDPAGDGTGGPGYVLPDEPPASGYLKGTVAMANSGAGTTGSQFFVVTTDEGALNLGGPPYLYSILGQVTEGFETVLRIEKLGKANQQPKAPIVIDSITISELTDETAPSSTSSSTSTTTTT